MAKKIIFLSYRRGDSPGYVKSLEKELEQYYGQGSVFRDVKDIAGGTKWKNVIEENLQNSAVLLLIIGPRWDSIWRDRINDEVNYVEYELNYANDLKVPVIPITLDGSYISPDTDLKTVSWLRDNQIYDMSDKQGRWENDFKGLVNLLENIPNIDQVKRSSHQFDSEFELNEQPIKKKKSGLLKRIAGIGLAIFVALFLIGLFVPEEGDQAPVKNPNAFSPGFDCKNASNQIERIICDNPDISNIDGQLGFVYDEITSNLSDQNLTKLKQSQRQWIKTRDSQIRTECVQSGSFNSQCVVDIYQQRINELQRISKKLRQLGSEENKTSISKAQYRDLSGTWQGADGTIYLVKRTAADRFAIESPGYGNGEALYIKNMPNKIRVTMYGIGRGEFSYSNSSDKIIGTFTSNDGQLLYDTLVKVSP